MTNLATVLRAAGTAAYPIGRAIGLEDVTDALFAAYVFGTGYVPRDNCLIDRSSNGRHLTNAGALIDEYHATVGSGSRLITPFSGVDLGAANSAITIVAIHKTLSDSQMMLASNYVNGSTPAIALSAPSSAASRAYAVSSSSTNSSVSSDPARGNQYVISAGVWTPSTITAHYIKNGAATHKTATSWTATTFGGEGNFTIGSTVAGFTGASDIGAVLFFDDALSTGQLEDLAVVLDEKLPELGLTASS